MPISFESALENVASFFSRVPAPINYTLLVLLQGLLFVGGSLLNGLGWIAILVAVMLSDIAGSAGAGGAILYLYIIGCGAGVINILGFKTTF